MQVKNVQLLLLPSLKCQTERRGVALGRQHTVHHMLEKHNPQTVEQTAPHNANELLTAIQIPLGG